jgi:hypothetical protein
LRAPVGEQMGYRDGVLSVTEYQLIGYCAATDLRRIAWR